MRERIVGAARRARPDASRSARRAFTYHVEGARSASSGRRRLVQLIDDSADRRVGAASAPPPWASMRLGVLDLLRAPRRRARAPRAAGRPRGRASSRRRRCRWRMRLQTLADVRDPASIVVEEAPSSRPAMQRHLPILRSETFYTMASGGLGYGLPAAVGVALARPAARSHRAWSATARRCIRSRRCGAPRSSSCRSPSSSSRTGATRRCRSSRRRSASRRRQAAEAPSCRGIDFVALARGRASPRRVRVEPRARSCAMRWTRRCAAAPALVEIDVA